MLTVLDIDNLQISLASVSCQYPELTINTILERIWKTKCDLFRLKFDAIIVKFVAMQDLILASRRGVLISVAVLL